MPRERRFGPRFTRWEREAGLGYDFKQGSLVGIMRPDKRFDLTEWRITVWVDGARDVTTTDVWGDTPWTAIENLDAQLEEEAAAP